MLLIPLYNYYIANVHKEQEYIMHKIYIYFLCILTIDIHKIAEYIIIIAFEKHRASDDMDSVPGSQANSGGRRKSPEPLNLPYFDGAKTTVGTVGDR